MEIYLQTSLDFEKGGNLEQLFQIYEFCRKQLIKAFIKVVDGINRAINTLNQIINAWKALQDIYSLK